MLYVHLCESLNDERQFGQSKLIAYTLPLPPHNQHAQNENKKLTKQKYREQKMKMVENMQKKKEIGIDRKQ